MGPFEVSLNRAHQALNQTLTTTHPQVEEAVLQVAEARPMRYSYQEWVALLQVGTTQCGMGHY